MLANNLANASTTGFRAEMPAFRAVPVLGDGASTRMFKLESTVGHDSRTGGLEGSDASPVENMVAMIAAARQFEPQMKLRQSAEQKEQSPTRLLAPT